jgi:hypothetical protein
LKPHPNPVPGDGNCLYHAVAQQLNDIEGSNIIQEDIRKTITPWLLANPHTEVPTGHPVPLQYLATTLTNDTEDYPDWEEYIYHTSLKHSYAEQPHMWAIASMFQVRIQVYSAHAYPTIIPISSTYKHTLYIQYQQEKEQ